MIGDCQYTDQWLDLTGDLAMYDEDDIYFVDRSRI